MISLCNVAKRTHIRSNHRSLAGAHPKTCLNYFGNADKRETNLLILLKIPSALLTWKRNRQINICIHFHANAVITKTFRQQNNDVHCATRYLLVDYIRTIGEWMCVQRADSFHPSHACVFVRHVCITRYSTFGCGSDRLRYFLFCAIFGQLLWHCQFSVLESHSMRQPWAQNRKENRSD